MKTNQQGSAHAAVTICLVAALIFALGWIFWQNFIMKKPANSQTSTTQTSQKPSKPAEEQTKESCLSVEKLCFSYPKSWDVTAKVVKQDGVSASDSVVISNKDNTDVQVLRIETGATGLGGTCGPEVKESLEILEATETKVMSGGDESKPVYAVKAIYHSPESGYVPLVYLSLNSTKVGEEETCLPQLDGVYPARNVSNANVAFGNSPVGTDLEYLPNKSDAEKVISSENYEKGYDILKSVHY